MTNNIIIVNGKHAIVVIFVKMCVFSMLSSYGCDVVYIFEGECSVFKKNYTIDENDSLSEYNKIPLGHNRTNGAVYSKIYF